MKITAYRVVIAIATLGIMSGAFAQQGPMTFMTTFRAEGSSSRTAQIITPKLEEYLARTIELSFGQGARGALGVPGDGSTIFISTVGAMALLPSIIADYDLDPLTDLRPVSLLTETPDVLIVHSSLGINTIDELVAHSQQNPGALTYSYIAPRSIHRVEFSSLFAELGIEATPDVSFTGSVAAMEAIGNGDIDLVITTSPYVAPLVDSGAAVALAVAHHERIPLLPGVPTMQEIGVASIPHGSWAGLFVPKGTSDEDLAQVFSAVEFAMNDPEVAGQISELGMVVSLSDSPEAFAEFITAESQRLKSSVERYEIGIE
jgi:tripartite-type tricarboxylate transporter receptor subunit TctC